MFEHIAMMDQYGDKYLLLQTLCVLVMQTFSSACVLPNMKKQLVLIIEVSSLALQPLHAAFSLTQSFITHCFQV